MLGTFRRRFLCVPLALTLLCAPTLTGSRVGAAEINAETVLTSIKRGKTYLLSQQNSNGSWTVGGGLSSQYPMGVSSLVLLALINGGMTANDPAIQNGLEYLRSVGETQPTKTYEIALMISALSAANDGQRDKARILTLAERLVDYQIKTGDDAGGWSYGVIMGGRLPRADNSNSQYAVLGLRDADHAGIEISRKTWERIRKYWINNQKRDGGWGYVHNHPTTGSMTVAGISSLTIAESMLRAPKDLDAEGNLNCCPKYDPSQPLQRGIERLGRRRFFSVRSNPPGGGIWVLYYLYGLERAGRLGGVRFFGESDWYREGAKYLTEQQDRRKGFWKGKGGMEAHPLVGTSFALLFLSKGLSPVLISKMKYGSTDNWNRHRDDIRNLTEDISGREKWPKLLSWQVLDLEKVHGNVSELQQSPILYISGKDAPMLKANQINLLRKYVDEGGFIFAVRNCGGAGFDRGIRKLVREMFKVEGFSLERLPPSHPVYRSEFTFIRDESDLKDPDSVPLLYGVNFGCRTAIIYSPDDLSCLWDKWTRHDPPGRIPDVKTQILKATKIGINVVAYATGREIDPKLTPKNGPDQSVANDQIERGLMQIAKLTHTGEWNAAPQALRNLLLALNSTFGQLASTRQRNLPATDPNLFKYPLVYMHGRNRFQFSRQGREQLRTYLDRGGMLFADACCGAPKFDRSFRAFIAKLYPDKKLEKIPDDHALFTTATAHDIRQVKRRMKDVDNPQKTLVTVVRKGKPFLEGIEVNGRYAVIYSKYDISCALERQASVACVGYVDQDAVKIAVNVVVYGLLQNVGFAGNVKSTSK